MASKKHRRGIRGFYNRQARVDTVIAVLESKRQEADSKNQLWFESLEILKNLKDFSVIFPEINSEPIKLGAPFEATIKIGDDAPQEKILVFVSIIFPIWVDDIDEQIECFQSLFVDKVKKIIVAPSIKEAADTYPVLQVLYPSLVGGLTVTQMPVFQWYGNEKISLTDIKECPVVAEYINTPCSKIQDMTCLGPYIGRELESFESFREYY